MMRAHAARPLVFLTLLASLPLAASSARADDKEACVAASDQGQTLRDEGKLRAARAQMVTCSRDVCPAIVRHDCEKWLSDVDAMQPSVVLGARDPKGNDITVSRVLVDGVALSDRLDGKPIPIDPGEHTFRYEALNAAPVEQRAVIRVGEKNRMLTAVLMPMSAAATKPAATVAATTPPAAEPEEPPSHSSVPVASIALASIAVVAAAGFVYFGVTGTNDANNLRSTCAPNCAQSDVNSAHTKLIISDVALGVGVVSLGAAAWLFFTRGPSTPSPQTAQSTAGTAPATSPAKQLTFQADVLPRPGGGIASLTARF
jgi:hypothetical protein